MTWCLLPFYPVSDAFSSQGPLVCFVTRWRGEACHEEGNPYTLTYLVINVKALARARAINASLLTPKWLPGSLLAIG